MAKTKEEILHDLSDIDKKIRELYDINNQAVIHTAVCDYSVVQKIDGLLDRKDELELLLKKMQ